MASYLGTSSTRAAASSALLTPWRGIEEYPCFLAIKRVGRVGGTRRERKSFKLRASNGRSESYLDMWKRAVERDRKENEFRIVAENSVRVEDGGESDDGDDLEKKSEEFQKILEVPEEERDRVQRMQVIDRAAAAIAAARAVLSESGSRVENSGPDLDEGITAEEVTEQREKQSNPQLVPWREISKSQTPGPDFWSWIPPPDNGDKATDNVNESQKAKQTKVYSPTSNPIVEKERSHDFISIPFESKLSENAHKPSLPPLQSLVETKNTKVSDAAPDAPSFKEEHDLDALSSTHAAEAASALHKIDELSSQGVNLDESRWWTETGIEKRPDGVVCRWTINRGVSADHAVEWQDKYWEAADDFGYKELGSEKSGRDAHGNVWREYWRESMSQINGLVHIEKTADKWGKNGKGDEWQEKWWECYDASGKAEKWAHKWCSIDPNTQIEVGHAHVWHERWGEKYDGHGGSMKYTDKWAERCEGDGWTRWGDKWDENFDPNGHGVKQGETWWEGTHGERWNRTWGEGHNGSGRVHKYGKSSSGEHWDTHVQQDTWYERFPHYGFYHCYDNSVQLREVERPSEWP